MQKSQTYHPRCGLAVAKHLQNAEAAKTLGFKRAVLEHGAAGGFAGARLQEAWVLLTKQQLSWPTGRLRQTTPFLSKWLVAMVRHNWSTFSGKLGWAIA